MGRRRAAGPSITLFSFQDIITSVTGIMILVTLMMSVELIQRRQKASPEPAATAAETPQPAEQSSNNLADLRVRLRSRRELLEQLAGLAPGQAAERLQSEEKLARQLQADAARLGGRQTKVREQHAAAEQLAARNADNLRKANDRIRSLQELVQQVASKHRVVYNAAAGSPKQPWLVELGDERMVAAELGKKDKPQVFAGERRQADFRDWAATRDRNREYFVLLVKPSSIAAYKQARAELTTLGFDLGYDLLAADQTAVDPVKGVDDE